MSANYIYPLEYRGERGSGFIRFRAGHDNPVTIALEGKEGFPEIPEGHTHAVRHSYEKYEDHRITVRRIDEDSVLLALSELYKTPTSNIVLTSGSPYPLLVW